MATPHPGLYRKGRYWYYLISANGQRAHGSTRATDLATARRVLEEKRKELVDGLLKRPTRFKPVQDLIQEWLRVNRPIFSQGHYKSAESALRNWVVPVIGTMSINRVSTTHVMDLRVRMLEAECSGTYVNNTIKTLTAIFNFAVRLRYLPELPFKLKSLRVQKKPRATVPLEQVPAFLDAIDREARNPHIPIIIRVMLGLGLREAEALGMRWEWFDMDQRTYAVGKAKSRCVRVLPVPDWLMLSIQNMVKPQLSEWVFPAEDGLPHRAQFTKKVLQRVCKKMGLGNVTQHRLRASFASLLSATGCPIAEIQGLLGHRSVATTMLYVETSLENKRKAQDALSQKLGLA